MTSDIKTATSAVPSVLFNVAVGTSEVTLFTCPAGSAVTGKMTLSNPNPTGPAATVYLSKVKTGGTGATTPRVIGKVLQPGDTVVLSFLLGEGDFLSAVASTTPNITATGEGYVFSSGTGATQTGIRDDAVGSGGLTFNSNTVTSTCSVGNGGNRYLIAALGVCHAQSNSGTWETFSTLTMTCADGPMTRLVSVNLGGSFGSVHLFGRANPSNTNHTLTGNATKAGVAIDHLMLASMSLTGVGSATGAASSDQGGGAAMNLAVTSALGHRVFFAGVMQDPPRLFNRRIRRFDGTNASPAGNAGRYILFADSDGSGTVTATTDNSLIHNLVGLDLVPA